MALEHSGLPNLRLYYFNPVFGIERLGRGEIIRLYLLDNNVDFKYERYNPKDWPAIKTGLSEEGHPTPTLPYITVGDKEDETYYGKVIPVLRYLSEKLGNFNGSTPEERQLIDSYADAVNDWCIEWINVFGPNQRGLCKKTYNEEYLPAQYKSWENTLSERKGPYTLGDQITFADYYLFHMIEDQAVTDPENGAINGDRYPNLATFMDAFRARPNLKSYF